MAFKTLENSNLDDPEEHFAWALRNVPGVGAGSHGGTSIPPKWAAAISKHLTELGYVFGPWLARKAGPDGKVDVADIPMQAKKFQRPFRGPQNQYNPGSAWVGLDSPEPEVTLLPNLDMLTAEERAALLDAFRDRGDIPAPEPAPNYATVLGE